MKREILCKKCAKERRKLFPTNNPYPGEHIKLVPGTAKFEMLCDGCVTKTIIISGEKVSAFSLWADYDRNPYAPWESDFINIQ